MRILTGKCTSCKYLLLGGGFRQLAELAELNSYRSGSSVLHFRTCDVFRWVEPFLKCVKLLLLFLLTSCMVFQDLYFWHWWPNQKRLIFVYHYHHHCTCPCHFGHHCSGLGILHSQQGQGATDKSGIRPNERKLIRKQLGKVTTSQCQIQAFAHESRGEVHTRSSPL